jgi:F0F1-type ATP synthase assembly protein I
MKLLFTNIRPGSAPQNAPQGNDDTLGRGMDLALTVLVFLGLGWLIDRWLGLFPVFTIMLVMLSAIGSFIRMKYVYDATMERHEAERAAKLGGATRSTASASAPITATVEDAA